MAFYGSTPGYRQVLDLHGRSALFEQLHELSRSNGWARMPELIDDDTLRLFVAYGETPQALAADVRARSTGVDRVALHAGEAVGPQTWAGVVRELSA